MSITIRAYRVEDASRLRSIFYHTVHHINKAHYTKEQLDAWAPLSSRNPDSWLNKWATTPPFVAIIQDNIVGFAQIDKKGYIDTLYVHHRYHHKGIGSSLMRAMIDWAKQQSIHRIYAHVSITARPFFESKGFTVVKGQTVTVRGVAMNNIIMESHISS
ncbi:GNAT family N-acetyltransferase [Candidatus Thiosymbion oneisti]|uniref:GNAT family N-acetyltransferase n=1 Tax=Candidatus Thiosymbion oneisti TaxID=589554 RepID=UPI000B7FC90F|nr:GNAT family N-acetyltransferase [Candidatus Thiosymbion oneisti]